MRHLPIARPGAALLAACLMTTAPFASAQTAANPIPANQSAAPAKAASAPKGPQAVAPASTPEVLSSELVGKTFYLRGFYQDDKLEFATDGKAVGSIRGHTASPALAAWAQRESMPLESSQVLGWPSGRARSIARLDGADTATIPATPAATANTRLSWIRR